NGALKTAPRVLFMTHLDTVPLCAGAVPMLDRDRIVNDVHAALGGDNRTGCAVLVTLAAELLKHKPDHPPLTLLFTVREESGAYGGTAGDATNVVTDYVHVKGESRSHDPKFFKAITAAYKEAFERAAAEVTDHEGNAGSVKFTARTDYHPFRIKDNAAAVKRA